METRNRKTIYITNLPTNVTEDDLKSIFENFGICVNCELNLESSTAYFEFDSEQAAEKALAMDNVEMGSNQVRVLVAHHDPEINTEESNSYTVTSEKIDYSKSVQIFVGDIGFDVDEAMLREGFSQFGKIIDVKVVRMPDGKHRGFAFISFSSESEADNAIRSMNNSLFHNRNIKCNWATKNKNFFSDSAHNRKTNPQFTAQSNRSLEDIHKETPHSNTSVYVTGEQISEEFLRTNFGAFGKIKTIKAYPDKNHAFINYDSHDSAALAIYQWNNNNNNTSSLKCNWSKKSSGGFFGNGGTNFNNANSNRKLMENFYPNIQQQFYDNSNQFFNNPNNNQRLQQQQIEQYFQTNYTTGQLQPQQQSQQQYFNQSQQMIDYYNNMQQMQNYSQQYQNSFTNVNNTMNNNNNYTAVYPPQKSITPQSYPYYTNYTGGNFQQQYNIYQQ